MQLATYAGWKRAWSRGRACCGLAVRLAGCPRHSGALGDLCSVRPGAAGDCPLLGRSRPRCWRLCWRRWLKVSLTGAQIACRLGDGGRSPLSHCLSFALPFPLVIAVAALAGFLPGGVRPTQLHGQATSRRATLSHRCNLGGDLAGAARAPPCSAVGTGSILRATGAACSPLLSVVTFGGAYAVLTSLGQDGGGAGPMVDHA